MSVILESESRNQIAQGQYVPPRNLTRGKYVGNDPAEIMENAEAIPEPSHSELAQALGRIIVWLLDGGSVQRIGERVLILAYKIRPDLVGGATLRQLAKHRGVKKSWLNKISRQFTRVFGMRSLNGHASAGAIKSTRPHAERARSHGVAESHLVLVNRFCEWRAFMDEGVGAVPKDLAQASRMLADLGPIQRFIAELEEKTQ
jgi:hypothetical protein